MKFLSLPYWVSAIFASLFLLNACSDSSNTTSGTILEKVTYKWLTVTSPNGGESWVPGSTHKITWEKGKNAGKRAEWVGLHLYEGSGDSGTLIKTILANPGEEERTPEKANDGSYSWTIPTDTPTGSKYEIRIFAKDADGIVEEDESNAAFTIATVGSLGFKTTAFRDGRKIPERYTCDGSESRLNFSVSDVPAKAKSLVLFIDDLSGTPTTTTTTTDWNHWVVFDIPIVSTINGYSLPSGSVEGTNDANDSDYDPLCPDRENGEKGDRTKHTYRFELYAIDTKLNLGPETNRSAVVTAMKGHLLEKSDFKGYFGSE